jgi:hypothetical protein
LTWQKHEGGAYTSDFGKVRWPHENVPHRSFTARGLIDPGARLQCYEIHRSVWSHLPGRDSQGVPQKTPVVMPNFDSNFPDQPADHAAEPFLDSCQGKTVPSSSTSPSPSLGPDLHPSLTPRSPSSLPTFCLTGVSFSQSMHI